ncbi:MAG: FtsQ-type POTRA domain-containing protein [Actinomycetia bacterium]|nr:FtsQ-type POTRA domain-containing protein [Actinomycetes bacterium]
MSLDSDVMPRAAPDADPDHHLTTGGEVGAAKRRSWRHPSRRVVLVWGVLLLGILVGLGWLLSWSSPVPIREVKVIGADEGSVDQVLAAADLSEGTAISDVDAAGIQERVLAIPGVQGVTVELERPWTVAVVVDERFPFAQVKAGDSFEVLDSSGDVIRTSKNQSKKLPLVVATPETMAGTLGVLAELPEPLREDVAAAFSGDNGTYSAWLSGGTVVQFGSGTEIAEKARVVASLRRVEPKSINVSVPSRPTVTGQLKLPKKNVDADGPPTP